MKRLLTFGSPFAIVRTLPDIRIGSFEKLDKTNNMRHKREKVDTLLTGFRSVDRDQ
jgi:hypothetical protein